MRFIKCSIEIEIPKSSQFFNYNDKWSISIASSLLEMRLNKLFGQFWRLYLFHDKKNLEQNIQVAEPD